MIDRITVSLLAAAAILVGVAPAKPPKQSLSVVPYHANGFYSLGEKAGWTVSASPDIGKLGYSLRKNNKVVVAAGDLDLSSGKATVETTPAEPTMLYLEIKGPDGKAMAYGAAVAPEKLAPVVPRPADFDKFWKDKIDGLRRIPENVVLTPGESGKPGVEYATIRMDHVNGTHVYGQIAKPSKPGKYPAMLILQWASPPYRLWSPWVADPASQGWIALNIEPHDVLPTEPQSYYDGLPAALKSYNNIGQDDRDKSYFVEMYLRGVRAVDYLTKLPEWDGKTLLVMGTSMGGQQSLAVAGLHPKVTHLIVNEPAGCDLNADLQGRQGGYPFFPSNQPKVMEAARYVDCVNFASRIHATSLVAMGFTDTAAPPAGIWTAFNLIKGPKEAAPMFDSPHNNLATPEQQRPYTARAAEWLDILAKGGKLELKKKAPR